MTDGAVHPVTFSIGPKGKFVLPAAVRRAANLVEGTELVAIALGEGRVLLETGDAVRQRVWAGAPEPGSAADSTVDVRRMRQEDLAVSDTAAARRSSEHSASTSEERGAALLEKLGR